MIARLKAFLARAKAFSERDLISSVGHGLLCCAVMVACRWAAGPLGIDADIATWYGAALGVGFYFGREVGDARRFAAEREGNEFMAKLGDGWLDFMAPLVFTSFLGVLLT